MTTGGMPSGVPPSVYRTPVDALSYPLMNRQLVNLQLANTGGSQYSPELFTPLDTPYYTAPSTCVRMDTPRWSTLTDLHIDIRRLSALAYPDTDHKTREVVSCDYFIDALGDPELGLKIRERQPKDLDGALHIALQLEVWHKDSERLQLALPKLIADNKKLHYPAKQSG